MMVSTGLWPANPITPSAAQQLRPHHEVHKNPAGEPTNRCLNGAGGVHLMVARGPHLRITVLYKYEQI